MTKLKSHLWKLQYTYQYKKLKPCKICQYKMLGPIKYRKSNDTGSYCLRLEGAVDRFLSSNLRGWLLSVVCEEGCLFTPRSAVIR